MLGIVTRVTVKLTPKPAAVQLVMAAFRDVDAAGRAVARVVASGVVPAGLEMMDALAVRAAEDFVHAGYPLDAASILLCELDGDAADLPEDAARVRAILEDSGAYEVRTAANEEERLRLWSGRKNSFPAVGRRRA